ncbi:hypothetical protein DCAR_0314339 [Daucus carota subsp. sativus]|uniref:Xyloglucan endotransglucosylase/hydrolase n=1 Tax=Daucus carota subsp. sativus TaxID=79200 RepID=A0AAF0WSP2_DAUCS|nr:hypothetical protein DCAR_0314339 [Daucus carota subsp. sativus]
MASHFLEIFGFSLLVFVSFVSGGPADDVSFDQNYFSLWGLNHITRVDNDKEVQLLLDQYSGGAGFRSISEYGSGKFGIRMKLPDANSTSGIIICFYVCFYSSDIILTSAPDSSNPGNHDELDFEFAGGGLQTNIFAGDSGSREERYQLWFDPRKDFHLYEILWNPYMVVFYVDKIPVRVYKNYTDKGVNYISNPMHTEASVWTGDWAGTVDWKQGPFVSSYRRFGIHGCKSQNTSMNQECLSPNLHWNLQKDLTPHEQKMHQIFREKHVVYDYCLDKERQQNHPECQLPRN